MAFTPYNYMPPSYNLYDDEEERRRREAEAAAAAGLAGPAIPDLQQPAVAQPGMMPEPTAAVPAVPEAQQPAMAQDFGAAPETTPGDFEMVNGRLVRKKPEQAPVAEAPAAMPTPQLPQPSEGVQVASAARGMPQMPPAQAPVSQPQSPYSLSAGTGAPGLRVPGQAPAQQPAPGQATAAAPTPTMNAQQMFQENQDNLDKLMAMRNDANVPEYLRRRSGERAFELMNQQRQKEMAEQRAQQIIASGDGRAITNALQGRGAKGDEGNWLKMIMLGFISPQLAGAEAMKLGLTPTKWDQAYLTDEKGQRTGVEIQRRADGKIISGTRMDGTPLSPAELASAVSSSVKMTTGGEFFTDKNGQIYRAQSDERGNQRFTNVQNNQLYTGKEPLTRLRDIANMAMVDYKLASDLAKKHKGNVMDMWKDYQVERGPQSQETQQEFFRAYGYSQVPGAQQGTAVQQGTGQGTTQSTAVQQGTGQGTTQSTAVQQGTGQGTGVSTGGAGAGTTAGGISTPIGEMQRKGRMSEAAAKERIETAETIPREFIKLNTKATADAAATAANAPQLIATIDRIIRTLEQRPDFANSLQSPAFTAFVVAQGPDAQKRLEDLSNAARIQEPDKPAFQSLVNDLRRLEVAGITQSGLTATQLNTERESQRVIDALAITLRNKPEAARAQAEIARAQIEYQRRFARFLADADPTQNPAAIRRRFDDTIGDKIYQDLAPKLEAIARGGVVDFRSPR